MIKLIFVPGQSIELDISPGMSVSDILSIAGVELKENQAVAVGSSIVSKEDFDNVHVLDGYLIIATGAKGGAPTPKIRKVRKFLKNRGFSECSGGKGDHIKYKNSNGEAVILNPDNRDKQVLDLGSAKSLAAAFGFSLVELYAVVE